MPEVPNRLVVLKPRMGKASSSSTLRPISIQSIPLELYISLARMAYQHEDVQDLLRDLTEAHTPGSGGSHPRQYSKKPSIHFGQYDQYSRRVVPRSTGDYTPRSDYDRGPVEAASFYEAQLDSYGKEPTSA